MLWRDTTEPITRSPHEHCNGKPPLSSRTTGPNQSQEGIVIYQSRQQKVRFRRLRPHISLLQVQVEPVNEERVEGNHVPTFRARNLDIGTERNIIEPVLLRRNIAGKPLTCDRGRKIEVIKSFCPAKWATLFEKGRLGTDVR